MINTVHHLAAPRGEGKYGTPPGVPARYTTWCAEGTKSVCNLGRDNQGSYQPLVMDSKGEHVKRFQEPLLTQPFR